jgi:hypothetical protein
MKTDEPALEPPGEPPSRKNLFAGMLATFFPGIVAVTLPAGNEQNQKDGRVGRYHWTGVFLGGARFYALIGFVAAVAALLTSPVFQGADGSAELALALVLEAVYPVGVAFGLAIGLRRPRLGGWIATVLLVGYYVAFAVEGGNLRDTSLFRNGQDDPIWTFVLSGGGIALVVADMLRSRFGSSRQ